MDQDATGELIDGVIVGKAAERPPLTSRPAHSIRSPIMRE
jgi:hypothetical protein